MSSQISAIFTALAGQSVTAAGETPTVWSVDDLRNVEPADCPVRLLLPGGWRSEGAEERFVALGNTVTVPWRVVDLCLWRPVGQGLNKVGDTIPDLIDYAAAYVEMIRSFRSPTAQSNVAAVMVDIPPLVEWPIGSGRWFFGVEVTLQIEEVIT